MHTLSRKGRSSASRLLHEKNVARRRHAGDGGAPEGDGRASRRAPGDAAAFGKRACAEASGPSRAGRPRPRGGAPARRSTCGAGHSPPRKAAGPAPHGNGLRAYSQNPKPIGHTNGEGVPVPATKRGTEEPPGRPQREYSHRPTRGTAANPPSPPSQASPPPTRGTGRPLAHIGGAALRTGTGPGAPEASAETQAPAARAGSGTPRASRKGNGATCRTASGFRPRPLP